MSIGPERWVEVRRIAPNAAGRPDLPGPNSLGSDTLGLTGTKSESGAKGASEAQGDRDMIRPEDDLSVVKSAGRCESG